MAEKENSYELASREVGKKYPDMQTYQSTTRIYYDGGMWNLTIGHPHMTNEEFHDYECGNLQIALADIMGVLFVLYKTSGQPWCDVPYEPRLTPEPMVYPQIQDKALCAGLVISVYDTATGELKAVRLIGLPNELSNQLHARCTELDTKRPMDALSHNWKVHQVYRKYRKTTDMLREVRKVYDCDSTESNLQQ